MLSKNEQVADELKRKLSLADTKVILCGDCSYDQHFKQFCTEDQLRSISEHLSSIYNELPLNGTSRQTVSAKYSAMKKELRSRRYDLAFACFNNTKVYGLSNLKAMLAAYMSGAPLRFYVLSNGKISAIDMLTVLKSIILTALNLIKKLLALVLVGPFLMVLVTLRLLLALLLVFATDALFPIRRADS